MLTIRRPRGRTTLICLALIALTACIGNVQPPPTNLPADTPTAAAPAATLPLNHPWLVFPAQESICGTNTPELRIIALAPDGGWTELSASVTAYARRTAAPPLLAICNPDHAPAILDPVGWTRTELSLVAGTPIIDLLAAPDGRRALALARCIGRACAADKPAWSSYIVDLPTGTASPFSAFDGPTPGTPNDGSGHRLLAWGGQGIYADAFGKGRSDIMLVSPDVPTVGGHLAKGWSYDLQAGTDLLASVESTPTDVLRLILVDPRRKAATQIDEAGSLSRPAIAPDGSALVYFRAASRQPEAQEVELVNYTIRTDTKTVLPFQGGLPYERSLGGLGNSALFWSQDGERIIAFTQPAQGPACVSLLSRAGTLLNAVEAPEGSVYAVTADDQVALLREGTNSQLTWLPLRPGASPYRPNVPLPQDMLLVAVLPPAGTATPPATALPTRSPRRPCQP